MASAAVTGSSPPERAQAGTTGPDGPPDPGSDAAAGARIEDQERGDPMAFAVTDRAIGAIEQMVLDGELRPGDRLPPEKELSERIGVCRTSLREAVKALSVIRVLDVRQGDGTYVTALEPAQLLESLAFVLDLRRDASHVEILEIRRLLEPVAVEQACPHLTGEDFAELDRIMEDLDAGTGIAELVEADLAFHRRITDRCPNVYLRTLLESLGGSSARARVWRGLTDGSAVRIPSTTERTAGCRSG